jgi:hypothetical protein
MLVIKKQICYLKSFRLAQVQPVFQTMTLEALGGPGPPATAVYDWQLLGNAVKSMEHSTGDDLHKGGQG